MLFSALVSMLVSLHRCRCSPKDSGGFIKGSKSQWGLHMHARCVHAFICVQHSEGWAARSLGVTTKLLRYLEVKIPCQASSSLKSSLLQVVKFAPSAEKPGGSFLYEELITFSLFLFSLPCLLPTPTAQSPNRQKDKIEPKRSSQL